MLRVMPKASAEEVSKKLFGNSRRLEILARIAAWPDGEALHPRAVAAAIAPDEVPTVEPTVSTTFKKLGELGLLVVVRKPSGQAHGLHKRTPSSLWDLASQFWKELESADPARTSRGSRSGSRRRPRRRP